VASAKYSISTNGITPHLDFIARIITKLDAKGFARSLRQLMPRRQSLLHAGNYRRPPNMFPCHRRLPIVSAISSSASKCFPEPLRHAYDSLVSGEYSGNPVQCGNDSVSKLPMAPTIQDFVTTDLPPAHPAADGKARSLPFAILDNPNHPFATTGWPPPMPAYAGAEPPSRNLFHLRETSLDSSVSTKMPMAGPYATTVRPQTTLRNICTDSIQLIESPPQCTPQWKPSMVLRSDRFLCLSAAPAT